MAKQQPHLCIICLTQVPQSICSKNPLHSYNIIHNVNYFTSSQPLVIYPIPFNLCEHVSAQAYLYFNSNHGLGKHSESQPNESEFTNNLIIM